MKHILKIKLILLLIVFGCKNETIVNKDKPKESVEHNLKESDNYTGIFTFDKYNDNGDYNLLTAYKNDSAFTFINNTNDRSLLKDDVVEITWEKDKVVSPVENEKPEVASWIINLKKIKNGSVANFRKKYKKEISYHYDTSSSYTESYLDDLYLLTEYYIANSQNKLLKHLIENNDAIQYSIEQQNRHHQEYTVLGVGSVSEHRVLTVQWLYYNVEKDLLYEYDLPNDTLIAFK